MQTFHYVNPVAIFISVLISSSIYECYTNICIFFSDFVVYRVLKPPGGGTSDIFGGSEPPVEKPTGRKKSVQASSIVLDDSPAMNGVHIENGHSKQGTCNERLFGPPLENGASNAVAKTNGEIITNGNDHPGRNDSKYLLHIYDYI